MPLKRQDARRLSPVAQEDLRRRVVHGVVEQDMSQSEAARVFGVSRQSVNRFVQAFRDEGEAGLVVRPRGRPKGGGKLTPRQEAVIKRLVIGKLPDQLMLPFFLWTRDAVGQLIEDRYGVRLSKWTVGRMLKRWGLTPQKPVKRAFEKNPVVVQQWLNEEYPRIRAEAQLLGAAIHWGDEMGVRSDHQTGTTYALKGQTPAVPGTGQRFGFNVISSITNRGDLAFMVFEGRFTADVYLQFLKRLVRQAKGMVFLIVDRHPVHRSRKVKGWLEEHADEIRQLFLPPYSPELNPDELLNHDVKANAVGRKRARTKDELKKNVRSHLRSRQARPEIIASLFKEKHVRYAADWLSVV